MRHLLAATLLCLAAPASAADPRIDALLALPTEKQRAEAFIELCRRDCGKLSFEDLKRVADAVHHIRWERPYALTKEAVLATFPEEDREFVDVSYCDEWTYGHDFCEQPGKYYGYANYRKKVLYKASLPLERLTWQQVFDVTGSNCVIRDELRKRWGKANKVAAPALDGPCVAALEFDKKEEKRERELASRLKEPKQDPKTGGWLYDFGDGKGYVPAHRHGNGNGWVADTAQVSPKAYVGQRARVYGKAVLGDLRLDYDSRTYYPTGGDFISIEDADVGGDARIDGVVVVKDGAKVTGGSLGSHFLYIMTTVKDGAVVTGGDLSGDVHVSGNVRISGGDLYTDAKHHPGRIEVRGDAEITGGIFRGKLLIEGDAKIHSGEIYGEGPEPRVIGGDTVIGVQPPKTKARPAASAAAPTIESARDSLKQAVKEARTQAAFKKELSDKVKAWGEALKAEFVSDNAVVLRELRALQRSEDYDWCGRDADSASTRDRMIIAGACNRLASAIQHVRRHTQGSGSISVPGLSGVEEYAASLKDAAQCAFATGVVAGLEAGYRRRIGRDIEDCSGSAVKSIRGCSGTVTAACALDTAIEFIESGHPACVDDAKRGFSSDVDAALLGIQSYK